jgi:ABC-type sulfate transport system permease component
MLLFNIDLSKESGSSSAIDLTVDLPTALPVVLICWSLAIAFCSDLSKQTLPLYFVPRLRDAIVVALSLYHSIVCL